MWSPWEEPGLEHLSVAYDGERVLADGLIIGIEDEMPFRLRYEVRCDAGWRVRELTAASLLGEARVLHALSDGEGNWTTGDGRPLPFLGGCVDVDISATPFTNTLPVRRLDLEPGESQGIAVVYVIAPEMRAESVRQRYTCLERSPDGGLYRFEDEGLFRGFGAELPVDADGLVLDYPEVFRRVWSG